MLITENWGEIHTHNNGILKNHLEIIMITFWYIFFLYFASLCGYSHTVYRILGFTFFINSCEKFSQVILSL